MDIIKVEFFFSPSYRDSLC